jgi:RHS repeat-associated protein
VCGSSGCISVFRRRDSYLDCSKALMPKPHATPASPNSAAIPCVLSNILAEVLQVLAHGHHELISVWEADYFPFGSERQVFTNIASNSYQFTGYEYDSDTQYNYAIARFEAGRWGQFLTPNPYLGSGNIGNPQSLNRYSYVLNDPLKFIDPLGLDNDCGGPCTDFTAGTFGDCALNVSYHKETGEDGKRMIYPISS